MNTENFGSDFLQYEELRINVFAQNPEFGTVPLAEEPASHDVVGFAAVQHGWRALVIKSIVVHHRCHAVTKSSEGIVQPSHDGRTLILLTSIIEYVMPLKGRQVKNDA
jgi:hypothetical protein